MVDSKFWLVPPDVYDPLNEEFKFNYDPCPYPYQGYDGCSVSWGTSNWVNPPFRAKDAHLGNGPTAFARKAIEQHQKYNKTSVLILPVQGYVNLLLAAGAEARAVGRVRWIEANTGKPCSSPSNNALFILRGT